MGQTDAPKNTASFSSKASMPYAISQGTKCKQFLFSLSLSPPQKESVSVSVFEQAISDIENKIGLAGQPRVIVFHKKEAVQYKLRDQLEMQLLIDRQLKERASLSMKSFYRVTSKTSRSKASIAIWQNI